MCCYEHKLFASLEKFRIFVMFLKGSTIKRSLAVVSFEVSFYDRKAKNPASPKQIVEEGGKASRATFCTVRSSLYILIQNAFTDSDCF